MELEITINGGNGHVAKLKLAGDTMVIDVVDFFEALGITDWELDHRKKRPTMNHDGDQARVVVGALQRSDYGAFAAIALNTIWS
jgi:hypothetical protein